MVRRAGACLAMKTPPRQEPIDGGTMRAREIMTREPACCTPDTAAEEAAKMMRDHDCGVIPVVDNESSKTLVGVVTDRDIALRGVGEGLGPNAPVGKLMTKTPQSCSPEDDVRDVEQVM